MEKKEIAELFMKGIDCSQVVVGAFVEELGITTEEAYKMSAAFGGGMGLGETCGAVVGAMIVLGLKIWTLRSGAYGAEGYYECKTCRIFYRNSRKNMLSVIVKGC